MKNFVKSFLTSLRLRGIVIVHRPLCDIYRTALDGVTNTIWLGVDLTKYKFSFREDGSNRLINKFQPHI